VTKSKVMVAAQYTGSANSVIPVARRLQEDDKVDLTLIANGPAISSFTQAGLSHSILNDYTSAEVEFEDEEKPNLLVTGSSGGWCVEKKLILEARKRGVRSISVIDLPVNYIVRVRNDKTGDNLGCMPDIHTALDAESLEKMVKEGLPRERLKITGNPYFDDIGELNAKFTIDKRKEIREYFGVHPEGSLITFISQPIKGDLKANKTTDWGYNEETIFKILSNGLNDMGYHGTFVIKFHPRETFEDIVERTLLLKDMNLVMSGKEDATKREYNNNYNTRETMKASNLVVGMMSTSLMEACLLDTDVLSLQVGLKTEDPLITNKNGYSLGVYNTRELVPNLMKILYNGEFREELKQRRESFVEGNDGKATERVVKLIYEELKI